ncbi:MAG: metallophosphoesterase [Clostridiales bacterium]|jgi:predicted MPP superfamily phosphohydrolase|nr:metallophosphoesterase [Clostridiales bacterium]
MSVIITIAAVFLIAGGVFIYARYVEPQTLVVTRLDIPSGRGENVKVAQLNDIHLGFSFDAGDLRRVMRKINTEDVDIVVFVGDLFDNYPKYSGEKGEIELILSQMKAKEGKFAVLGNHDYGVDSHEAVTEVLEKGGFTVLKNKTVELEKITVSGIDDMLIGFGKTDFLSSLEGDWFNLVLCHEPDVFDRCDGYNVSLMLAGHTHGGQIQLPLYGPVFLPNLGRAYREGLYEENGSYLYVNRGLGTTKLPARFLSPPELTVITIK